METRNHYELSDENIYPDEQVLEELLGGGYSAYCDLLALFERNEMEHEWRYYHDGNTWLFKVQKKKRTIVWMSAWKGYIQALIYFPEKYIEGIYHLPISEELKEKIRQTKNSGKSKPCIFQFYGAESLDDFSVLMQYKIASK